MSTLDRLDALPLDEIAAGAAARDADPGFPHDAVALLRDAGALSPPGISCADEWAAVRAVARADASVGRIYDGHLNAVERLAVGAPPALRAGELKAVAEGRLLLGVWGADPGPGEGEPARLDGDVVSGVKTFCSGAGGVDRALVLVRDGDRPGPPLLAYVDLSEGVSVDRTWFRGAGMRASESHRVVFERAPVLTVLGGPGEITREPFFGRDALRTAAMWAGVADAAADSALALLRSRPTRGDLEALAAGQIAAASASIDALLTAAALHAAAGPDISQLDESIVVRERIADAARTILDRGAATLGSRPLATGSDFERARRDLELFLHQHRLDPLVAKLGARLLDGEG